MSARELMLAGYRAAMSRAPSGLNPIALTYTATHLANRDANIIRAMSHSPIALGLYGFALGQRTLALAALAASN